MKLQFNLKKKEKATSTVNQKIYRIIKLYVKITSEDSRTINIDEYCTEFSVSERTLRRDIKTLKEIFPELLFTYNRNWSA